MSYDKQKKTQTVHISNTNMHECGATGGGGGGDTTRRRPGRYASSVYEVIQAVSNAP